MTAHVPPLSRAIAPVRSLATALSRVPTPWVVAVYAVVNLPLIGYAAFINLAVAPDPHDWAIFAEVPQRLAEGTLYAAPAGAPQFRWSPVAAWLLTAILPIGYVAWTILHFWALALLRHGLLVGVVLLSYGFWMDLTAGNAFVFVFVAAVLAWRGSLAASLVYAAFFVLMPRPVQLPLLLWLLWNQPALRMPFAGMFVLHGVAVLLSGYGEAWLAVLLRTSTTESAMPALLNLGPSVLIGPEAWLVIGMPLAALLAWRGQLGWASLALSPYWLAQYLLMPLLHLAGPRSGRLTAGR